MSYEMESQLGFSLPKHSGLLKDLLNLVKTQKIQLENEERDKAELLLSVENDGKYLEMAKNDLNDTLLEVEQMSNILASFQAADKEKAMQRNKLNERLREVTEAKDSLEKDKDKLKSKNDALIAGTRICDDLVTILLRNELTQFEKLCDKLSIYETYVNNLLMGVVTLQNELISKSNESESRAGEIMACNRLLEFKEAMNNNLANQIQTLLNNNEDFSAKIKFLESSIHEHSMRASKYKDQIESSKLEKQAALDAAKIMEDKVRALEKKNRIISKDYAIAMREKEDILEECALLYSDIEVLRSQHTSLTNEKRGLQTKFEIIQNQRDAIKIELKLMSQELTVFREQEKDLEDSGIRLNDLRAKYDTECSKVVKLNSRIEHFIRKEAEMQTAIEGCIQSMMALESQIATIEEASLRDRLYLQNLADESQEISKLITGKLGLINPDDFLKFSFQSEEVVKAKNLLETSLNLCLKLSRDNNNVRNVCFGTVVDAFKFCGLSRENNDEVEPEINNDLKKDLSQLFTMASDFLKKPLILKEFKNLTENCFVMPPSEIWPRDIEYALKIADEFSQKFSHFTVSNTMVENSNIILMGQKKRLSAEIKKLESRNKLLESMCLGSDDEHKLTDQDDGLDATSEFLDDSLFENQSMLSSSSQMLVFDSPAVPVSKRPIGVNEATSCNVIDEDKMYNDMMQEIESLKQQNLMLQKQLGHLLYGSSINMTNKYIFQNFSQIILYVTFLLTPLVAVYLQVESST